MTSPFRKSFLSAPVLPCALAAADDFLATPSAAVIAALRLTPGRILVLGAGGKMGLHLCLLLRRALASLGRSDDLLAVSRFQSLRDGEEFTRHGIAIRACDLERPAELTALPEAAAVFFLAGVKFGTAGDAGLLHRLNVAMPRRVAERFAGSTIVAFSTGCIYPFVSPASGGATEQTRPAANGDYASSCLERERVFAEVGQSAGTRTSLIRLNYSVEFRYGILVDIALKVLRREPVDVTTGHINAIWQTDALAYAIQALAVAGNPAVPVNITGPGVLSVREVALRFSELLDRPVTFTGTEADSAWLNNAAWSHRRFGAPAVSLSQMQQWIAGWLLAGGEVWNKPTGFERRDGKF